MKCFLCVLTRKYINSNYNFVWKYSLYTKKTVNGTDLITKMGNQQAGQQMGGMPPNQKKKKEDVCFFC